jgi:hypothetical protein
MIQSPLSRVAGPMALTAGALTIVAQVGMFLAFVTNDRLATLASPLYLPSMVTYFVALCALLIALVAAYEWQAHRGGVVGLIGLIAALVGTTALAGNHWFDTFAGPWLADSAPDLLAAPIQHGVLTTAALASYGLFALGWMLFGSASLRAGVFPTMVSASIVVGGVVGFLALSPPFGIPLGIAMLALGVWLTRTAKVTAPTLEPVAL